MNKGVFDDTCLATPANPLGWPLTLTLNLAYNSVTIWPTAGLEPGFRWQLACSKPGSSPCLDSGSPQKGDLTLLWHVLISIILQPLKESNIPSTLQMSRMEELSRTYNLPDSLFWLTHHHHYHLPAVKAFIFHVIMSSLFHTNTKLF